MKENAHTVEAGIILDRLEVQLIERIGQTAVDALRATLETPWGLPPAPSSE